jgi:hypothetical protein
MVGGLLTLCDIESNLHALGEAVASTLTPGAARHRFLGKSESGVCSLIQGPR